MDFNIERVMPYIVAGLVVANIISFPLTLVNFHTLGTEGIMIDNICEIA